MTKTSPLLNMLEKVIYTLHLVITDVFYPKKKSDSGEDADEDEELSETLGRDDSSEDEEKKMKQLPSQLLQEM